MKFLVYLYIFSLSFLSVFAQNLKTKKGKENKIIWEENFDQEKFPPHNWTDSVFNANACWIPYNSIRYSFDEIDPSNISSAICPYSTMKQNEWLISPEIPIAGYKTLSLEFYAGFSGIWLKNAAFHLFLSQDKGENWEIIWKADTEKSNEVWQWRKVEIDLYDVANNEENKDTLIFAWQYVGKSGDLVAIDNIKLYGGGLSTKAEILELKLKTQTETPIIDSENRQIFANIVSNPHLDFITPSLTLSKGATSVPGANETLEYIHGTDSVVYDYTVSAADRRVQNTWKLIVFMSPLGTENEIIAFNLPQQAGVSEIDTTSRSISLEVEYGTDLSAITPVVMLSAGAYTVPELKNIALKPNLPFVFEVYAQDPAVEPKKWSLTVAVKDYENEIVRFSIPGQKGETVIDHDAHTVKIEVDFLFDLTAVVPEIEISAGASISPDEGETEFVAGVEKIYTVKAANGDEQVWKVIVKRALNALFYEDFNKENAIDSVKWFFHAANSTDSWKILKQTRNNFTSIDKENIASAFCGWSKSQKNEWLISRTIDTENSENLFVSFYAGFNPMWTDSADLMFYIINTEKNDTVLLWSTSQNPSRTNKWEWKSVRFSLEQFLNKKIKLAWRYFGKNGDAVGIENIIVFEETVSSTDDICNETIDFAVYPNPTRQLLNLMLPSRGNIQLYSLSGKLLLSEYVHDYKHRYTFHLKGYESGVYILRFISDKKIFSKKIIKTKK